MALAPSFMKAVITTEDHNIKVQEISVPSIESERQILVKIHSAGINPTDWKHAKHLSPEGTISGCDLAGVVEDSGRSKEVKVGDRLAAFVHGGNYKNYGAFAEYALVEPDTSIRLPEHMSFDQGATLGIPLGTAAFALYHKLKLPEPGVVIPRSFPVLIWSGSSAVGQYAIQLAKLSGLSIVTTASFQHHERLRSLGADSVFDYHDPHVSEKIKEATHNDLAYALDCVSSEESLKSVTDAFGEKGGKVAVLLSPEGKDIRKDAEVVPVLVYTCLGKEFTFAGKKYPASADDRQFYERWVKMANGLLEEKKIVTLPTEDRGGLEGVASAFKDMEEGKNKGVKYVIHP